MRAGRSNVFGWMLALTLLALCRGDAGAQVLGDTVDAALDFQKFEQVHFVASRVTDFDPATGRGRLRWDRHVRRPALSFGKIDLGLSKAGADEFPGTEYEENPRLPFSVTFVGPRTVRLRFSTRDAAPPEAPSLMLDGPVPSDNSWRVEQTAEAVTYTASAGRVRILRDPFQVELYDAAGRLLTRTQNAGDPASFYTPVPFSFVRRARDLGRSTAAAFRLAHDEKLFGCGESFTRLDKRGQRVVAYTRDAMGVESEWMYKPVPFFLSSRGYGLFVHTGAPVTFDFGRTFGQHNTVYTQDEELDLFLFLGTPKEVLSEYTRLTGRSPVPPLWSFGFWMSRITYRSEAEVRDVAAKLRRHRIPSDVIHLDTGWFETEWRGDYRFSKSRFPDPARMIADLKKDGFRVSLWQYPSFTPKNELYAEVVSKGYAVRGAGRAYEGARWHRIEAGPIPVVLLARGGSVIPHVGVAQSTDRIDWTDVELRVYAADGARASGLFTTPGGKLHTLRVEAGARGYALKDDPSGGGVKWRIARRPLNPNDPTPR
jgi:alpha-D-xyloside xylohydrolase